MDPLYPTVMFDFCPIRASLGTLGRKWALIVLRDVTFFPPVSFGQLMKTNPGLTPRVLSLRLKELQHEGLIERVKVAGGPRKVGYQLTAKGHDIIPVLTAFIQFGIRHHAEQVFEDGRARKLEQVFPDRRDYMLQRLLPYAREWEAGK